MDGWESGDVYVSNKGGFERMASLWTVLVRQRGLLFDRRLARSVLSDS